MNILFGIGNEEGLDDGVGVYIARSFNHPDWEVYNCGTLPENFTSVIRRQKPETLVMVDAGQMDLAPGSYRIIPGDKLDSVGGGTHALPLSIIINIMQPHVANPVIFIGIQPDLLGEGSQLSPIVKRAAADVIAILAESAFEKISCY